MASQIPSVRVVDEPRKVLLCNCHVHTTWSDGKLSVREVVDLYGSTGKFDVIASTDHILMLALEPKRLYSWKTADSLREELAGHQPRAAQQRGRGADPLPRRLLGRLVGVGVR